MVGDRITDELNNLHGTVVKHNDEVFELNQLEKEILVKVRLMEAIYRNQNKEELQEAVKDPFVAISEALARSRAFVQSHDNSNVTLKDLIQNQQGEANQADRPLSQQKFDENPDNNGESDTSHNKPINLTADDFIRIISEDGEK